jgi:hypothetical protein
MRAIDWPSRTEPVLEERQTIAVRYVTHEEAQAASDLVEELKETYGISARDLDLIFNGCVAVFLRGQILDRN